MSSLAFADRFQKFNIQHSALDIHDSDLCGGIMNVEYRMLNIE